MAMTNGDPNKHKQSARKMCFLPKKFYALMFLHSSSPFFLHIRIRYLCPTNCFNVLLKINMYCYFCLTCRNQIYIAPSGVQKERIQVSRIPQKFEVVTHSSKWVTWTNLKSMCDSFCPTILNIVFVCLCLFSARGYVCVWHGGEGCLFSTRLEKVEKKPVYTTFYERLLHERLGTLPDYIALILSIVCS